MNQYHYAHTRHERRRGVRGKKQAQLLSNSRLNPSLSDPDYLIYIKRREYIENLLADLKNNIKNVIDVGGRVQPYKPLFNENVNYFGIDPVFEGLVSIVGIGEYLPIRDNSCDFVICTQTLSYVENPGKFISEICRILKKDSPVFLTVPAFFPQHHDENWRFLPHGLELLFRDFKKVEILPEGYSISGFFRTLAVIGDSISDNYYMHRIISIIFIPFINLMGKSLDKFSNKDQFLTTNYSVIAYK